MNLSEVKLGLVTYIYNPCTGKLRLRQENNKIEVTRGHLADLISKVGREVNESYQSYSCEFSYISHLYKFISALI